VTNRPLHGARGAGGAIDRPSREPFQVAVCAAFDVHQRLRFSRGIPRWMARNRHRLHGGPLCFQKGVPYTSLMELVFALLFGLVIGSFLNVVILRLPEGVSISRPRSHCPQCKQLIPWYDN